MPNTATRSLPWRWMSATRPRAIEDAVARFGRIDVLVNNAGFGQFGPFEENEPLEIEQQFATNVFGTFHVTRAVLLVMRRQRAGYILNVSAIGGFIGFPGTSIYSSSKFAVEGFSESLALEVLGFGIKVTIVEPGFIRTDFLDKTSIRYGTSHRSSSTAVQHLTKAQVAGNHSSATDHFWLEDSPLAPQQRFSSLRLR
jgi:NAD(P)-dependent dehydrogenase (short-subunit alcohol dehydrogenase family)